jgi:serine/threonine-protein kinase
LASYGLVVGTVSQAYSSTVAAGRVISQNPTAGSTAVVGSAVDLTISLGPAPGSNWVLQSTSDLRTIIPSPVPSHPITVTSAGSLTYHASSSETEYKLETTGISAVGGTWTVNPSTGALSTGANTIDFTIQGLNVNVSSLSSGNQKVAETKFYTR